MREFRPARRPGDEIHRPMQAIGVAGNHLPNQARVDLFHGGFQGREVTAHQAARHFEIFLAGQFARAQDAPDAGGIHGERFFHEHMHALRHGVFKMQRPERRRGGQQHHAARI
ncbi:MAG: hypothetical protein BWX84_00690 [Verrucomicrobia bacterium ADurb.Bin118]|nr:MAG: hypothetical protein BWX84_00690 [Verrucomicrobia bacterium ADurb.Bin118]